MINTQANRLKRMLVTGTLLLLPAFADAARPQYNPTGPEYTFKVPGPTKEKLPIDADLLSRNGEKTLGFLAQFHPKFAYFAPTPYRMSQQQVRKISITRLSQDEKRMAAPILSHYSPAQQHRYKIALRKAKARGLDIHKFAEWCAIHPYKDAIFKIITDPKNTDKNEIAALMDFITEDGSMPTEEQINNGREPNLKSRDRLRKSWQRKITATTKNCQKILPNHKNQRHEFSF